MNKIDENLTLWRYMDFTKFVSLLQRKSLYFRRVDLYKEDATGISLVGKIEDEWNLFSENTVATEILKDILPLTSFSAWTVNTTVKIIDEIEENISYIGKYWFSAY